jgi:hypothetical protein
MFNLDEPPITRASPALASITALSGAGTDRPSIWSSEEHDPTKVYDGRF